ncbi:MAG: hypothetical protein ACREUB_06755 [Burkholderiales bacterium]
MGGQRQERGAGRHITARIHHRIAIIQPAPVQLPGLKYGHRRRLVAEDKERLMQLEQQSPEINVRRVVLEMLWLVAQALFLGVAVAVVLAVPVIWLAIVTP